MEPQSNFVPFIAMWAASVVLFAIWVGTGVAYLRRIAESLEATEAE